ncbi:protein CUSTOS [Salarias fasciatus]|uniref:protein CUSTOS n=1 Tax=Salarias fasciatus TaxID=181472 RepID=UPI001176AFEA|nr:protein CUSTOS [Salarias fasciatus]
MLSWKTDATGSNTCLMMAASTKRMAAADTAAAAASSSDDSSSDDEGLKRCQEAVWEAQVNKDVESNVKQSKRVVVSDHDHDGNELQVTKGFQTHVAKKLGHLLDRCISEMQPTPASCVEPRKCGDDDDDDDDDDGGFRLFSTSIPGQKVEEAPAPARRRPVPSSSDSDSEMETRLKEAAVSIRDILPSSALHSTLTLPETLRSETVKKKKKKKAVEDNEDHAVMKKKKCDQVNSVGGAQTPQSNGENGSSEQVKVKRKKKKKREQNTEEEVLE